MKKVSKVKKLGKDKIIEALKKEILRKEKEISRLKEENQLLLKVSVKNAKRRLEED